VHKEKVGKVHEVGHDVLHGIARSCITTHSSNFLPQCSMYGTGDNSVRDPTPILGLQLRPGAQDQPADAATPLALTERHAVSYERRSAIC